MAAFRYRALAGAGRFERGSLDAADVDQAIDLIREMGLTPVEVQAEEAPGARVERLPIFGGRPSAEDLILITRQLETMLDAGLPLLSALETLESQTAHRTLSAAIGRARADVEQGSTLTEALRRHPHCFPSLYVNLVHAGEEAGLLNEMLARIASLLEYEAETQQRIRAATFYPCLVLLELFVAGIVLLKFVLPRFAALFRNFQTELPLPTRILVAVSDVVEKQWLVLLLLLGGTVAGTVAWARSTRGRDVLDRWIITVPIFGPIFQKTIMSRFARAMAALIGAGIPIVRALELAREVTGNRAVGREVDRMREGILAGAGLADPVRDSPLFPPLVVKMMAVGEETGSIDKMLLKVSGYYDRDVDYAVKHLSTAIEPVLLAVLGTAVLFTALAVFLPLWNLIHVFQH